jgi:hypothetical protein
MQHNATAFYETWPAAMNAMKAAPGGADIGKAFGPFFQGLMKEAAADGGLAAKHCMAVRRIPGGLLTSSL